MFIVSAPLPASPGLVVGIRRHCRLVMAVGYGLAGIIHRPAICGSYSGIFREDVRHLWQVGWIAAVPEPERRELGLGD